MRNGVHDWVQEGQVYIWRYAHPRAAWRGWQFTADAAGCRSLRNLLDRMRGGGPCHRTLRLASVTEAILSVPNAGHRPAGRFEKLRIEYRPDFDALGIVPDGTALTMTVGGKRVGKLSAAFASVEIGDGDFGIATSDVRRAEGWMFWWMPDINYFQGKRQ